MDNSLMESLAKVDLPARELRVVMAIARQTVGYQVESKRLTADEIGAQTNMRRDVVSKAISHLLERRVLFRVGGSRGEIGITDPKEWQFYEPKQNSLSETKTSHSAQIVSLGYVASETKPAHSHLYTKKEPPITLPSEEIITPQPENPFPAPPESEPEKPEPKAKFGKAQMLADNPHKLDESLIVDYLAVRKAKKAPATQRVWNTLNAKLEKCKAFGIGPSQALEIAIENGWQGFEVDWIVNRVAAQPKAATVNERHNGFAGRNYRAGLKPREDGSLGF